MSEISPQKRNNRTSLGHIYLSLAKATDERDCYNEILRDVTRVLCEGISLGKLKEWNP